MFAPPQGGDVSPIIAQLLQSLGGFGQGQQGASPPMQQGTFDPQLIQKLLQGLGGPFGERTMHAPGPGAGAGPGIAQANAAPGNPLGSFPPNASVASGPKPPVQAGAVGAAPGRGFVWGGRTWGPNELPAFASYLKSRGVDFGQWARAHPGAFASFQIDPNMRQVIAGQMAGPSGGMAHA